MSTEENIKNGRGLSPIVGKEELFNRTIGKGCFNKMADYTITAKEAKDISNSALEAQQREKTRCLTDHIHLLERTNPKIFEELFLTISKAALKGETKVNFCRPDMELDSIFTEPLKWYLQNLGFTVEFKKFLGAMYSYYYSFDISW